MVLGYIQDQLTIFRRIAEREKFKMEDKISSGLFCYRNLNPDPWIHMLDEIERTQQYIFQLSQPSEQKEAPVKGLSTTHKLNEVK